MLRGSYRVDSEMQRSVFLEVARLDLVCPTGTGHGHVSLDMQRNNPPRSSDIDIAVEIPSVPDVKDALFQLSSRIKSSGLTSTRVVVNHRARAPIISFTTREEYGESALLPSILSLMILYGQDLLMLILESTTRTVSKVSRSQKNIFQRCPLFSLSYWS